MVPVAPVVTGVTSVFTFHVCYFYGKAFKFLNLFWLFLILFLSPEIAASINIHVPSSLSWIMMSSLLLGMVLLICTCWFHDIATLPSWPVSTNFGICSLYSLHYFTPISLHMLKCSSAHYHVSLCTVLLPILDMMI